MSRVNCKIIVNKSHNPLSVIHSIRLLHQNATTATLPPCPPTV